MNINENKIDIPESNTKMKKNTDDMDDVHMWKSCCFQLDKNFIAYVGQFIIIISVISFSFIMLIQSDGRCEESSPYFSLISFILGKLLSTIISSA
jgi:hypothetical protein